MNIDGHMAETNEWYDSEASNLYCLQEANGLPCDPTIKACLFDLRVDPCERSNIADLPDMADVIASFMYIINNQNKTVSYTSTPVVSDQRGNPVNSDGAWQAWIDSHNTASRPASLHPYLYITLASVVVATAAAGPSGGTVLS